MKCSFLLLFLINTKGKFAYHFVLDRAILVDVNVAFKPDRNGRRYPFWLSFNAQRARAVSAASYTTGLPSSSSSGSPSKGRTLFAAENFLRRLLSLVP